MWSRSLTMVTLVVISHLCLMSESKPTADTVINLPLAEANDLRGRSGGGVPNFFALQKHLPPMAFSSGKLVSGSQLVPMAEIEDVRRAGQVDGHIVAGPFSLRQAALLAGQSLLSNLFPWLHIRGHKRIPLPPSFPPPPIPFPRGEPRGVNGNPSISRPGHHEVMGPQVVDEIVEKHVVIDKRINDDHGKEHPLLERVKEGPITLRSHGIH